MLLSLERPFVGAFAFHIPRATLLHFMVWCKQSCRRRLNMCKRAIGILQERGRSCRFLSEIPAGEPGYQLQALSTPIMVFASKRRRTTCMLLSYSRNMRKLSHCGSGMAMQNCQRTMPRPNVKHVGLHTPTWPTLKLQRDSGKETTPETLRCRFHRGCHQRASSGPCALREFISGA